MLGNPGSNQLELFWDVVDALDQKLDAKMAVVQDAIKAYNHKNAEAAKSASTGGEDVDMEAKDESGKESKESKEDKGFVVGPETTEDEFREVLKACEDPAVDGLQTEEVQTVFAAVSGFIFTKPKPPADFILSQPFSSTKQL